MPLLENIKNKPYEKRVKFIWIILFVCFVLLLVLWGITYFIRKQKTKDVPKNDGLLETVDKQFNESKQYWESVAPKKPENK